MFCSNCGKTLKGDVTACPHCGSTVGESRFEGHPYTGAQMRTKPGEAVRLPGNHTKTTFMGKTPELDQDVDARTTYRATADQVYSYDEPEETLKDDMTEEEYNYDTPEYEEEAYAFDSPDGSANEETAEKAEEASYETEDDVPEEDAYDEASDEAAEYDEAGLTEEAGYGEGEDEEEIEYGEETEDEEEFEEPKNAKEKKLSRRERRIREEDEMIDAELEELRIREIRIDTDDDLEEGIRKYKESGRYDEIEEEEVPEKAAKTVRIGQKINLRKLIPFGKRAREEDFDSLTPDEFELADDESAFDLNDLPEEGEEAIIPYDGEEEIMDEFDEEIERELEEEFAGTEEAELDEEEEAELEEMVYNEKRRSLSPNTMNIIKYAACAVLIAAIAFGLITLFGNLSDGTKKAPVDGVTYDLYYEGIELMQYRAGKEYRNSLTSGYDGSMSKLLSITEQMTKDLDSISGMMPENPLVNDQRYIAALTAIQNNINAGITNDLLSYDDATKTQQQKDKESEERWKVISDTVDVLAKATSTAQLEAIVKGEKIEVIQQTTPTPVPTATPVPYVVLSKGSEGAAVRQMQNRLAELGYLTGTVDGIFGNQTKTAIQLFQKNAGMTVTGIADADTQIALFSDDAPKKK